MFTSRDETRYWARQSHAHGTVDKSMSSTAGDFRNLVPLVLADALRQAGTAVYEPVQAFRLEIPADSLGVVLPALLHHRAKPDRSAVEGAVCVVEGEGLLETAFGHCRPVRA